MSRAGVVRLVEANAPLWGGEAEVFRAYWGGPGRTDATDRAWIAMRDAQFSHPLSAGRLTALMDGRGAPVPFDWDRLPAR